MRVSQVALECGVLCVLMLVDEVFCMLFSPACVCKVVSVRVCACV